MLQFSFLDRAQSRSACKGSSYSTVMSKRKPGAICNLPRVLTPIFSKVQHRSPRLHVIRGDLAETRGQKGVTSIFGAFPVAWKTRPHPAGQERPLCAGLWR